MTEAPDAESLVRGSIGIVTMVRVRVVLVGVLLVLAGCGVTVPTDPEGTLERVDGGFLRVGVSPNPPWTDATGPSAEEATPSGTEVDLVARFAEHLDAEVTWTVGGEEDLIAELAEGRLDLVVGGLTAKSPWASHAALTRPYVTVPGPDGAEEMHVMATPMGENAFLVTLETFLVEEAGR